MDEEKAGVEDLLRRGEELLQQTSDEGQREELRLLLLRLQSQYSAHRVRCKKNKNKTLPDAQACMRMFSNLRKHSCLSYRVRLLCTVAVGSICMCLAALGTEGASNQAGGSLCGLVVLSQLHRAKKRVCSRGERFTHA